MGIRGRTPETGSKGLTFTHDKCRGEKRSGWLSGDVHVIACHVGESRKSKPCARLLLGHGAECPGCAERMAVEELGYVPLRDQTGKPVCVVVRKERIAFIANMERGTAVYYGREEGRYESVFVIPSLKDLRWDRYFTQEPRDDMSYWLPLFLGVPHLAPAMAALFRGENQCQPTVTDALPPTTAELTEQGDGQGDGPPIVPGVNWRPLSATTERLEAKKERDKRNAEFARKNGKH